MGELPAPHGDGESAVLWLFQRRKNNILNALVVNKYEEGRFSSCFLNRSHRIAWPRNLKMRLD